MKLVNPAFVRLISLCWLLAACVGEPLPDLVDQTANTCGDGVLQAGEACDDGNDNNYDACLTTCRLATCHDGFRRTDLTVGQAGAEQCDDGNTDDNDACVGTCQQARCGDGLLWQGQEQCDDGNDADPQDGCHRCRSPGCGDGVVQDNEACDDGNTLNDDACTNDCVEARCGDGIRRLGSEGEACDDGNSDNTDACTNQCTLAACGDGFMQEGEACDDGNQRNTDACTNDCVVAVCGDAIARSDLPETHDNGEGCDDADSDNNDGCTNACKRARCGDSIVQRHVEACDDGNDNPDDNCVNCRWATCGNGVREDQEECDDGNDDAADACTNLCLFARCGDGVARADLAVEEPGGEACDDGNERDDDFCLNNCVRNVCGDGVVRRDRQPGQTHYESCDDGNDIDDDGCTNNCLNGCGDGRLDEGEDCDDGNFIDGDDCTNTCTIAMCGDGVTRDHDPDAPGYETCDDGNDDNTDACTTQCRTARCGDGIIRTDLAEDQAGYENCEDGDDDVPTDGCHQCRTPRCGDGIVRTDLTGDDPGHENCDDGDEINSNGCRNDCQWGVCGDGVRRTDRDHGEAGFEACDDGNTVSGDGCRGDCSLVEVVQLSLNENTSCAIFGDARARCWGQINSDNQRTLAEQTEVLDVGHTHNKATFIEIAHTCIVNRSGRVWCWGKFLNNARGPDDPNVMTRLHGRPRDPGSEGRYGRFERPMEITTEEGLPLENMTNLHAHSGSMCGLNRDGEVWCWGGAYHPSSGPFASRASLADPVDQIAMGAFSTCARTRGAGLVFCWGNSQLAGMPVRELPTHVPGTINAVQLMMGYKHACFMNEEGIGCWGFNNFNQMPLINSLALGCANTATPYLNVQFRPWPDDQIPWAQGAGLHAGTLGLTTTNQLQSFGVQPGQSCSRQFRPPHHAQVIELPNDPAVRPQSIHTGLRHACLLTEIGSVYCWGENTFSQAGLGTETIRSPTLIIP